MTLAEWIEHLSIASRCSICEMTPQQAGELAKLLAKLNAEQQK